MSDLFISIPRSKSKRLSEALQLAEQFPGFLEKDDSFELRPSVQDVQTEAFRKLIKVAGNWKGAVFYEDGQERSRKEFEKIGLRIGDPVTQTASKDWIALNSWYNWSRPQSVLQSVTTTRIESRFPCSETIALYPVELLFAERNRTIEASLGGAPVGHLSPSRSESILARVEHFPPMSFPGVIARGMRFCYLYVWPDWPISDGYRICAVDENEDVPWWTHDVAHHHLLGLWRLKFPVRKEPVYPFKEKIQADLEGRKLEPRSRQNRTSDAPVSTPDEDKKGCGSRAASAMLLAILAGLLSNL